MFTNDAEWLDYIEGHFTNTADFLEFCWVCDNWIQMKGDIWSRKIV